MTVRRLMGALAATGLLTGATLLSGGVPATASTTSDAVMLSATATGENEVPPGSGEEGATATGSFQITPAGSVTYTVRVSGNSEPVTAGHIHRGATGVNGDVVVPFDAAPINSGGTATVQVDAAIAAEIIANPAGFYLNTHSVSFAPPAGIARGQLTAAASGSPGSIDTGTGGQAAENGSTGTLVAGAGAVLLAAGAVTVVRRRRAGNVT